MAQQFRITCAFECLEPLSVEDEERATHIFRIVQEAVTNAITHGKAKDVLARLGAKEARVRSLFETELAAGTKKVRGQPELTRRARKALCLAADEAQRAGRVAYGPQHLLLGLLRTNEGMGFQMLAALEIDLNAVRAEIG